MIEKITVLGNAYNQDYKNPTMLWPEIGGSYASCADAQRVTLTSLPVGTTFDLSPSTNIYAVIGDNGIGKTTFLHAMARSMANARAFGKRNRTVLFNGSIGVPAFSDTYPSLIEHSGGFDIHPFIRDVPIYTYVFGSPDSGKWLLPEEEHAKNETFYAKRVSHRINSAEYAAAAFAFYMRRDELFESPNFLPYKNVPENQIKRRISLLFSGLDIDTAIQNVYDGCKDAGIKFKVNDRTHNSTPAFLALDIPVNPRFIQPIVDSFASERGGNLADAYRRLAYLAENNFVISQIPYDVNIYGDFKLNFGGAVDGLNTGVFDLQLQEQTNNSSKGQYTRSTLDSLLGGTQSVLLIDEPTAATDLRTSKWVLEEFLPAAANPNRAAQVFVATNDSAVVRTIGKLNGLCINMYETPARITGLSQFM
jgi:energy-coupling factor transporter ATP-binding protein EcfA2